MRKKKSRAYKQTNKNQRIEDYEIAVKNYKAWINSLEGGGYIPENAQGER